MKYVAWLGLDLSPQARGLRQPQVWSNSPTIHFRGRLVTNTKVTLDWWFGLAVWGFIPLVFAEVIWEASP